ncbi:alpha/beta hydrolase [Streptacidiphilus monticola]|uniref:Alpha/beta hydrolase n=1 Tax=Streptacidiphilus monticola TaxID=2161674 RepID=A0ABW1G489_9ACTN
MTTQVVARTGIDYGSFGKQLDVYRPAEGPVWGTVLLWHGRGPQERDVLATLAREAAGHGVRVVAPDWRSDAADGGWTHLRESVAWLRAHVGDEAVLAGWSLGARAAMATVLRPPLWDGWRPTAVVGIAGNYLTSSDPRMGPPAVEDLTVTQQPSLPVHLVHGTADAVVDVACSRAFARHLEQHRWPVEYTELETDHAGVVMAEYDRTLGRCRPATAEHALTAGAATARVIARAVRGTVRV